MMLGREPIVECTVKMKVFLFLCSLLLVSFGQSHGASRSLKRSSFPPGFIFGTASAAYQFEGAAKEGGRGPSLWDTYTHKYPERIADGSNGDIAIDQYNRYKEDVGIMKNMGLDAYRFSISWSRILPKGKLSGGINKEGIAYYNNLINELLANGLKPFVTIFHWDIPQALEDEYNGFLSPTVQEDFRDFADVCFKEFGDRVKFWITLNEPWTFSKGGYADGTLAPGRCSDWQNRNCTGGNSGTEPYLVTHHQLLSHAVAVKLYREKYQGNQKGMIGTTLVSSWNVPFSNKMKDQKASQIALDFMFGWFMDPLTRGEYPKIMRSYVGKRLPEFTKEESEMLKGSFDFIGLNYYSTSYTSFQPSSNVNASYMSDSHVSLSGVRNGVPIGKQAASKWLYVYPKGLRDLLMYTKIKYNNPLIYITENGVDELNNASLPLKQQLDDKFRIDFHNDHMYYLLTAIRDGVNVKGYFPWSLMDNFEWGEGYTVRFGMNYVDFKDGLKRYPKRSAGWFTKFLKS